MLCRVISTTFLIGFCLQPAVAQVKMEEKVYSIPSYEQKAANPMPRFYEGKSHQGVQRRIYPYPYDDGLTPNKRNQDYSMIHLENEYIDLAVSPQLGGRIYYADDKSNHYNYLYHNHVVKPSLIGMLGNWISGSLAWGFPHHHGPNTVESMAYMLEEKKDGSKTVWIRSWDRLHRMEVVVGYTVYPNSSIIEMTIHPKNRTAIANSFLFWTNPAVHCDSAYQVIFPPSVKYVTFHGKNQMTAWPIADSRFNNYDFTGIDISWWKNTHVPSSFFSWDPRENYFGGYDHNKEAGTVWVGNRYISPGMKYWADGNNANGLKTNEGLTDNDGRYIELMAGFYTDNQPDYSWLQPYETKIGKMIWFPIRDLGGLKYASREGALNYFIKGSHLELRLNTTSRHDQAKAVVSAASKIIVEQTISISPSAPAKLNCDLPKGIVETDLDLTLYDVQGKVILSYRPAEHQLPNYEKPKPVKPFPAPEEMKYVEELYLAGLRLDQFYNASVDPMPYYLEALKRDPGNYNVNTQLGIKAIKAYDWKSAEKYFRTAVERITANYTRPKDGEALYYLGVTLRALGQSEEAYEMLYRASWSYAWHTASYFQLASIDCVNKQYQIALEHLDLSISTNTDNMRALNLKAYVLRQLNRLDEAEKLLQQSLDTCKIDLMALNELHRISEIKGQPANEKLHELDRLMLDDAQLYLELASEYAQFGAYDDANAVLERLIKKGSTFPMVYYTMGYYNKQLSKEKNALSCFHKAASMPADYCYPFRWEEVDILNCAMNTNPGDARAPYYLGNLLFEHQPTQAIALWEKSLALDKNFYITYRNLAWAYKEIDHDYAKALSMMQKAFAQNSKDARLLFELDDLNDLNKLSPKDKYLFLKKNLAVVKTRSEVILRLATRAVEYGQYEEAIRLMSKNFIIESEGAREMQDNYLNCYVILAINSADKGQYSKAISYIDKALAYPIGLYGRTVYARLYYVAGTIYQKRGRMEVANNYYHKASEVVMERQIDNECTFYKGMALKAMGREKEGNALLQGMLDTMNQPGSTFFNQFEGGNRNKDKQMANSHYYTGLAYFGLGNKDKSATEFKEALEYNPSHIWSRIYLKTLK